MQVSLEWLNEYVDISNLTAEEIAHNLTMSGLEVEEIENKRCEFENITVAEIKSIKPHPNADKLQIAEVFTGDKTVEVVCGARNIAAGQIIPYASVGSAVKDRKTGEQFVLKPAKIRDVESCGMLCSAEELGLNTSDYQEDDGILILNRFVKDLRIGQDVKETLNIQEDTILHVAPTANRGDEMSVIGIAREVASLFNCSFKHSPLSYTNSLGGSDFEVEIKDEDTCKYYAVGVLKDIKIGPSPEWMKRRLLASGVRSISNVVDITNYVMLEYGQPLHAFDMDKLNGEYLCVRRATENETLVTLDETERKLSATAVVIANKNEPVALAGLMGGFNSEVDGSTKNLALESAYFTPVTNRKSSKSVGLRTEASARFERGVDIGAVKPALMRAMQLMTELAGASVEGMAEVGSDSAEEIELTLRFSQIKRILGMDIPSAKCVEILENLGFETLGRNDFSGKFLVPSYRTADVTREIDLIEEIARIYGYDRIEPTMPKKTQICQVSDETMTLTGIHRLFTGQGFYETVTSSLIGTPLLNKTGIEYNHEQSVRVTNPQSDEYTMLRQNLVPSILQVVKNNFDVGQKNVWIYEVGKTYFLKNAIDKKSTGVEEKRILAGAVTGNISSSKWHENQTTDFYTLKGVVEALLKELKLDARSEFLPASTVPYLHPGKTAALKVLGKSAGIVGHIGELHPAISEKNKLSQPVFVFEIDLEKLMANINHTTVKYKDIPLYPAVTRDIAFIIPKAVSYQEMIKVIKKASSNLLKDVEIFDVYEGEHTPDGTKSAAFRVTLQDAEATLTDQKIDAEVQKIRDGIKKAFAEALFRE